MKKKQPVEAPDTCVPAVEKRLSHPEDVFAYWDDEAMADAVPLPIEVDAESGPKRKGKQHHARRSKK